MTQHFPPPQLPVVVHLALQEKMDEIQDRVGRSIADIFKKDGPPGQRSTLLSSQDQLTLVGLASSAQYCLVMELRLSICKEKL